MLFCILRFYRNRICRKGSDAILFALALLSGLITYCSPCILLTLRIMLSSVLQVHSLSLDIPILPIFQQHNLESLRSREQPLIRRRDGSLIINKPLQVGNGLLYLWLVYFTKKKKLLSPFLYIPGSVPSLYTHQSSPSACCSSLFEPSATTTAYFAIFSIAISPWLSPNASSARNTPAWCSACTLASPQGNLP